MTAVLRLPRLLADSVRSGLIHEVEGTTLGEALESLFTLEPALRHHLLDEAGRLRPHVSVFVDGKQASPTSEVAAGSQIRVLQAVSGGDSVFVSQASPASSRHRRRRL